MIKYTDPSEGLERVNQGVAISNSDSHRDSLGTSQQEGRGFEEKRDRQTDGGEEFAGYSEDDEGMWRIGRAMIYLFSRFLFFSSFLSSRDDASGLP